MKQNLRLIFMTLLCAVFSTAWGQTTTTYTFTSNYWEATCGDVSAGWASGKNGSGFQNNGVQVTTNSSGANATSPVEFSNISSIVVTYNTNKSAGAGSIAIKVGDNAAVTNSVGYMTGTADGRSAFFESEFIFNPTVSGDVTLTVNCTTNSIYVVSVAITTIDNNTVATPTFSPGTGTSFYGSQTVTISTQTAGATIYYTTNDDDPTESSNSMNSGSSININETTTIKAFAAKGGMTSSSTAVATYTKLTPSIEVSTSTVNLPSDESEGDINVTLKGIDTDKTVSIVFYDENGTSASEPEWITVGYENSVVTYLAEANSSNTPRSVYFKVKGTGLNSTVEYFSDPITITQAKCPADADVLLYEGVTKYNENNDNSTALTSGNANKYLDYTGWSSFSKVYPGGKTKAKKNGGCLKFGSSSDPGYIKTNLIQLETGCGELTFYLKKYGTDSGKLKVTVTGATINNNGSSSNSISFTPESNWALCTVNIWNATSGGVTIKFETTIDRAYVDEIKLIKTVPSVEISSVGYATLYYSDKHLIVPSGVEAYTCNVNQDKTITHTTTFTVGNVIPAGTAVLLHGAAGTYSFEVSDNANGVNVGANMLRGHDVATETSGPDANTQYKFFTLSLNAAGEASSVGFYYMNEGGAKFVSEAHKAYLAVPTSIAGASSYIFDENTGIKSMEAEKQCHEGVYTLSGVRMHSEQLPAGIYIVNGKKMVIK